MIGDSAPSTTASIDTALPGDARLLDVERVSKRFVTSEGVVSAVDDVTFSIAPGEFVSIIGPSGCGKSTLFNIIGGLVSEYEGRVTVAGDVIHGTHPAIGMVFQEESTFPWRTVLDNVAFPLEIAGVPKQTRLERAAPFQKARRGEMRRAVPLPRTLTPEPRILLMDEPFAALDEQTRLLLGDKVLQIQQTLKQTTLLITHNLTEAVQLSDRVLVMTYRPGRLKRVVDIHLPHPRDSEVVSSDAFGHYVAEIWHDLREEASRGIRDDESRVLEGRAKR